MAITAVTFEHLYWADLECQVVDGRQADEDMKRLVF